MTCITYEECSHQREIPSRLLTAICGEKQTLNTNINQRLQAKLDKYNFTIYKKMTYFLAWEKLGVSLSMKKIMKPGNNMPVQAPLVPDPVLPYSCKNSKTVYAICEADELTLRHHLSATPFEYVNNLCMVYVNDFTESPELPYMDAGIIFTVKYKDTYGGYYMYEWEDDDAAIETGRYWGYPKKFGHMTLEKKGHIIHGTATRRGVKLIDIELDCSKPIKSLPTLHTIYPHLNLLTIPKPDGPGIFSQRVTARDNSSTCRTISNMHAEVKVQLNSSPTDPIGDFSGLKVLGGGYSITDFKATLENGWAKVIDTLI